MTLAACADPAPASLEWTVQSASYRESQVAVFRGTTLLATYSVNCDASEAAKPAELGLEEESTQIGFANPISHPEGLLIVACRVGAHSKELSVYDPNSDHTAPLWHRTGSYYAGWQMTENSHLVLFYDRPCEHPVCNTRFERVEIMWHHTKNASR